jgi:hypothetical protein
MRVLIACEFSGTVRDAFIAKGHDAVSCDLLPTDAPGPHIQGDVLEVIRGGSWDMMLAFPPCTHLAASGSQYWPKKQADGRQQEAIDFVMELYNAPIEKVAVENPVGILSSVWRKPDQIVQPFYFGDPFLKKTCLWLKNLPRLFYAKTDTLFEAQTAVEPVAAWGTNSYRGGPRKDGTRKINTLRVLHSDSHQRSQSFTGIANAMADQWG